MIDWKQYAVDHADEIASFRTKSAKVPTPAPVYDIPIAETFEQRDERQSNSDEMPTVTKGMLAWLKRLLGKMGKSSHAVYKAGEQKGFTTAEVAQAAAELDVDVTEEPWQLPAAVARAMRHPLLKDMTFARTSKNNRLKRLYGDATLEDAKIFDLELSALERFTLDAPEEWRAQHPSRIWHAMPPYCPVLNRRLRKRYPQYAARCDAAFSSANDAWWKSPAGLMRAQRDERQMTYGYALRVLGVLDEYATAEQIKRAYRGKAKALHPDTNRNDGVEMAKVNRAYAALTKAAKASV